MHACMLGGNDASTKIWHNNNMAMFKSISNSDLCNEPIDNANGLFNVFNTK